MSADENSQKPASCLNSYSCLYISRYSPERSPTDPYAGLPLYLSTHCRLTGIWGKSKKLDPGFQTPGIRIFELEPGGRGWIRALSLLIRPAGRFPKPDFILCGVDEFSLILGITAGSRNGAPVFSIVEDPPFTNRYKSTDAPIKRIERRIRTRLLRIFLSHCKGIFCFIEKEALNAFHPFRAEVFQLMNGVSAHALHLREELAQKPKEENNRTVGFIGTVEPAQGIDTLLHIFQQARKHLPDLRLSLIGPAKECYAARLHAELPNLQLQDAVTITGWIPYERMMAELQSCFVGVYCNPQTDWYYHAQPLKICEYLGLSKPVVAWDYPGIRRQLDNGRLGILVPPGNVEAFAEGLVQMADPEKRRAKENEIRISLGGRWASDFWYQSVIDRAAAICAGAKQ